MNRLVLVPVGALLLIGLPHIAGAAPKCPIDTLLQTGECPPPAVAAAPAVAAVPTAVAKLKRLAQSGMLPQVAGVPNSLALDAANEALQILGQIVVDRASAEAFRLLQERLKKLLACADSTRAKHLKSTCAAIENVRIQDLATTPQALNTALLQDLTQILTWHLFPNLSVGGQAGALLKFVGRDVAPLFVRSAHGFDTTAASLLAGRLRMAGTDLLKAMAPASLCNPSNSVGKANTSLAFASAGLGACFMQDSYASASDCPVTAVVAKLYDDACAGGDPSIRDMAAKLGLELQGALTATDAKSKTDVRGRLRAANDAAFDYLCASLDFDNQCALDANDPRKSEKTNLANLHAVYGAIIGGDNLQIVIKTATLLEDLIAETDAAMKEKYRRGFRLLGGILDYVQTFSPVLTGAPSSGGTDTFQSLHAQRTKILESLTTDMTDRTGRLGDTIWSIGGALRASGGWWFRSGGDGAYFGPLSLPLGVALDVYADGAAHGWHFEVSAVDLARYLSYQNGGKVNDVKATDAFTPGVGVAYFLGASLPLTVGIHGSYSPRYQFTDAATHAFSLSAEIGFYVPLLDLN